MPSSHQRDVLTRCAPGPTAKRGNGETVAAVDRTRPLCRRIDWRRSVLGTACRGTSTSRVPRPEWSNEARRPSRTQTLTAVAGTQASAPTRDTTADSSIWRTFAQERATCCARWGVPALFDFAAAAPVPRALSAKHRLADPMRSDATRRRYFDVEVFVTLHAPAEWPKFVAAEKAM